MTIRFTLIFCLFTSIAFAQEVIDFEEFISVQDTFWNGSDGSGGVNALSANFPNAYNDAWGSWSGWSVSTMTDTITPGYLNQYSASVGTGNSGINYAVSFSQNNMTFDTEVYPEGVYITNSTYAYLSMRDGDAYAKKFGGITGDDPDFFMLKIKGYLDGQPTADSIEYYLADYRFEDNEQDYIVKSWEYVSLESLDKVDSLSFELSSSDVGDFGMNTPAYFCIDDLSYKLPVPTQDFVDRNAFSLFPNPTTDAVTVNHKFANEVSYTIYTTAGTVVSKQTLVSNRFDVSNLQNGSYVVKLTSDDVSAYQLLIKQ